MDPLGEIREFTYESGLECDPLTKQPLILQRSQSAGGASPRKANKGTLNRFGGQPAKEKTTGYFDYRDNKFVLPDGRRVKVVVNSGNRARG